VKLTELEPELLTHGIDVLRHVSALADAQGVWFCCPRCGNHQVMVWFRDRGVPEEAAPRARWQVDGTSLENLTLSPSINILSGCKWHGWVRGGEVVDA
jgi:hypothetical protein